MIAVCVLTCDRPKERREYALICLKSLKNLESSEPLHVHVADDGSARAHVKALVSEAQHASADGVTTSNAGGHGYGANYNAATQVVHELSDLVLMIEDDWELTQPLDLDPIAAVLRSGLFGCVRLGYVGWTNDLIGKFVGAEGLTWLALDPASPELHVFTGGPRLETVEFERNLGPWPEGLPAGETEIAVCNRPESRVGVAWPADLVKPRGDVFVHIGSTQAEYDG